MTSVWISSKNSTSVKTSPVLFSVLCTHCNTTLRHKHRVHRVVTSAFWRTISHEGKIRLGW